jgi:CRP/FNR family transcriptional regulator, anaerobic regulatory protein
MGEEPDSGAITEDLLTGSRALRAAFLSTPLTHASGGTSIIRFDERDAPVFLIRRGVAYRSCELANGKRAIVDVLIPGDIAGLDHVLVSRSVGEFTAAGQFSFNALSASTVRKLMEDRNISFRVLSLLAEARWRIERLATTVMRMEAKERMAAFILGLYQRLRRHGLINGLSFNLPLTQEQIGDHLGLTVVHVNRTLRRLREERLVHVDRQMLMIMDYDGLRALLHGIPEPAYLPSPIIPETVSTEPIYSLACDSYGKRTIPGDVGKASA